MAILRFVLNTAGVWWIAGGVALINPIISAGAPRAVVGAYAFVWLVGIIPAVVLSARSSNHPRQDLHVALMALREYLVCMAIIVGIGIVLGLVMLPFSLD